MPSIQVQELTTVKKRVLEPSRNLRLDEQNQMKETSLELLQKVILTLFPKKKSGRLTPRIDAELPTVSCHWFLCTADQTPNAVRPVLEAMVIDSTGR